MSFIGTPIIFLSLSTAAFAYVFFLLVREKIRRDKDNRMWNGGICKKNGLPWKREKGNPIGSMYEAGNQLYYKTILSYRHEVIPEQIIVEEECPC